MSALTTHILGEHVGVDTMHEVHCEHESVCLEEGARNVRVEQVSVGALQAGQAVQGLLSCLGETVVGGGDDERQ